MSIGAFPKRGQSIRRPLKTAKEMAEELGLSAQSFGWYLLNHNGPKHITNARGGPAKAVYFDPIEVRRWWDQLTKSKEASAKV
jgi:hypothetical protein